MTPHKHITKNELASLPVGDLVKLVCMLTGEIPRAQKAIARKQGDLARAKRELLARRRAEALESMEVSNAHIGN